MQDATYPMYLTIYDSANKYLASGIRPENKHVKTVMLRCWHEDHPRVVFLSIGSMGRSTYQE